jgi:replicative DNA helicase
MTDLYNSSSGAPAIPYSQEAEEAAIGAVLINPDSYYGLSAFLKEDDFYLLRHRLIWQALDRLAGRSQPIDYLTLVQELRDLNALNDIGGPAYLTQLMNNTPTSVHAEVYGRIVEGAATRRRLIAAADQIKSVAGMQDLTVQEVIAQSEAKLFDVTERQLTKELIPMREAMNMYYERIEQLMYNKDGALGVPSGFKDLDKLLGGLQKSDLLLFAGRPGMGKTSFMLSAAVNMARLGARIAIFSMEMGIDQIVQRLVSMEAAINSQSLRLGQITQQEWSRFVQVAGNMSNFRIFIDDTAALNPMQLRTKCLRMAREHGVDLVVVDYIQLMNSGGVYENNRVQEISYISRSMKELARELNVPVLSAAQLSRAVEQRQDKRPQLSDLRESGCLAGESLVYLPDEGKQVPIRDLVGKTGFRVTSLNTETWKLEPGIVTNAFCTGVKPVYRLTTQLGRSIRATGNHKFLTITGWKRLDELTGDDHIALPRHLDGPTEQTMTDAELALLGHLIGDGCTLPRHTIQYTTRECDLAETVAGLATEVFGDEVAPRIQWEGTEHGRNGWYQVYLPTTRQITHGVRNPISEWLTDLGVFGLRSHEKFIPEKVFQQPASAIALFIRHLWATDGSIGMKRTQNGSYPNVYYATSSPQLASDLQTLLLRLSINARLIQVDQRGKGRDQYHVHVTGADDLQQFSIRLQTVGEYRTARLEQVTSYLETHPANTNRDIIPRQVWRLHAVPAMQTHGITSRQMQAELGNAYCGTGLYKQNISRERAARLAQVVQSSEIAHLAASDVYWDRIASIEPDGETEVFDLTVLGNSCFIANRTIVHNSLEQDADVVMFLYRDEVYNEATEFPNQAEIIIAKHRNGPTGTINLYFEKTLTRFMNAAERSVDLSHL